MLVHVQRQIGLLEAQDEIKSQVQEELGERQREMFLREQMKAIQKELGDDDQSQGDRGAAREARTSSSCPRRRARRSSASSGASSAPAASRWKRRSSARISSGSPSCRGTRAPTTTSTCTHAHQGARRGPLRPEGREGPRARVPRRAPAARAAARGRDQADRRVPGREAHARARKTRRRRSSRATTTDDRQITDAEGGEGPRDGEGPDPAVRRPAGRRQDVDRQVDRARARPRVRARRRSAARATRPTSAAIAAPTSARCPAASSRG